MKSIKKIVILFLCLMTIAVASDSLFRFAWLTDTHVGSTTGLEDLKQAVADVNVQKDLGFVIVSGDVTEMDVDGNLDSAKKALDELNIPYYVIPGNHDTKWSASGTRKFAALFGSDCFNFEYAGFRFIGFDQGPLLRMGDGLVTPERIRWLKETLAKLKNPEQPVFIVNHYPMDNSVSNWFEVMNIIRQYNIQAILHGHGHRNRLTTYEGIPGVMSRANLRGSAETGGYTIVLVRPDSIFFRERNSAGQTLPVWASLPIRQYHRESDAGNHDLPDFGINEKYSNVKEIWSVQLEWALAGSPAVSNNICVVANSGGFIDGIALDNGALLWQFRSGQPVFSTPAIAEGRVVVTSTDSCIYCIDAANGELLWKHRTGSPVVANPVIVKKQIFCGGSDGIFRSLALKTGAVIWEYNGVAGFVEAKPFIYKNKVIFGAWDNHLYALHKGNGKLLWKWAGGTPGLLYSPAAVWPVATQNKVFISAPDRYLSCINARNGETIWRSNTFKVRETIGISEDKSAVFARTMWDTVVAIDPSVSELKPIWISNVEYGYDIDPSMPVEKDGTLFFGTKDGFVYALDAASGKIKGVHRLSVALINTVVPLDGHRVVATAMDGTVALLEFD